MNEQFDKLIGQSMALFYSKHATLRPGTFNIPPEIIENFGKLIVKECADYVQFYYKDHSCEVIAHDMKTHFGVK